jgi:hypothetical protein
MAAAAVARRVLLLTKFPFHAESLSGTLAA